MKNQFSNVLLATLLAASNGLTLEAENIVDSLLDAHYSVQDAVNGVIDGVCYRDISLPDEPGFAPTDCPSGMSPNLLLSRCEGRCDSGWIEIFDDCYKCSRGTFDIFSRKCVYWSGWTRKTRSPERRDRNTAPLDCPSGTVKEFLDLCFDEPEDGYQIKGGLKVSDCPADLPHDCGYMCTTTAQECTETLQDQGTSAA